MCGGEQWLLFTFRRQECKLLLFISYIKASHVVKKDTIDTYYLVDGLGKQYD